MMKATVGIYTETGNVPTYAKRGDSGMDVATKVSVSIRPGETTIIPTGVYVSIPYGLEIQVRPRSGLSHKTKMRVANSPGTIDSNYLGEIGIIVDNIGEDEIRFNAGDRVAQLVLVPVIECEWNILDSKEQLGTSNRGSDGYGSTGV